MPTTTLSTGAIADYIAAVNAHDTDAILATFAPDAFVNAEHGEYTGTDAVRRFIDREIVGDRVTMEVREVIDHHGDTIVHALFDGDFDKTGLPDEVILSNYFATDGGKIVSLIIFSNRVAS
jgi:ketosteroid isomerase-like protein